MEENQKVLPAFLLKSYEMVNDPEYSDIIGWSESGNTFIVYKPTEFSQQVLPKYFKHSNFSSFIRQLNLYDFHKCGQPNWWEWKHPNFKRDQKHLLKLIRRKTPGDKDNNSTASREEILQLKKENTSLMDEMKQLQERQQAIEEHMQRIISENVALTEQVSSSKQVEKEMQQTMQKIMYALLTLFSNNSNNNNRAEAMPLARKRRLLAPSDDVNNNNNNNNRHYAISQTPSFSSPSLFDASSNINNNSNNIINNNNYNGIPNHDDVTNWMHSLTKELPESVPSPEEAVLELQAMQQDNEKIEMDQPLQEADLQNWMQSVLDQNPQFNMDNIIMTENNNSNVNNTQVSSADSPIQNQVVPVAQLESSLDDSSNNNPLSSDYNFISEYNPTSQQFLHQVATTLINQHTTQPIQTSRNYNIQVNQAIVYPNTSTTDAFKNSQTTEYQGPVDQVFDEYDRIDQNLQRFHQMRFMVESLIQMLSIVGAGRLTSDFLPYTSKSLYAV
jgi:hypothetical protein